MTAYTVELYGCDDNSFIQVDLEDAEFRTLVKVAVALNKKYQGHCHPSMHIYEGHVEPSFFGNNGAFEEIV